MVRAGIRMDTHFGVLDFQVEVEVYARAGFLLLHTLTLPLENLKLQIE